MTAFPAGAMSSSGARAASSATESSDIDEGEGLTWLPAWRLAEMIAHRDVSSVDVVQHFLSRIEEHDPELHAFRDLDAAGALAQATRADQAVKAGDPLGRLHGVPIAFKELFAVEGLPAPGSHLGETAMGGPALATRDDIEVARLRAAGAVIVGVTVAAVGPWPGMPDPGDLPRNPWNTSRAPGGSSAGSAAAVAGGLVPLAIGDDGAGSVRVPSAFCGLLGLAPTRGRVPHVDYRSAAPHVTVTAGPMTRSVQDCAIALQVIAGPDGRDFVCLQDEPPDYLGGLRAGVSGKRFLWTEHFGAPPLTGPLSSPRTLAAIRAAAGELERAGGSVEDAAVPWQDPLPSWVAAHQLIGQDVALFLGHALSESELVEALEGRERNWRLFLQSFTEYDFVVSPTVQLTAPSVDERVEFSSEPGVTPSSSLPFASLYAHTMLCNVLGLPAISIPAGFENGMPIGLQVIGRPGSESGLLQVAQAFLAGSSGMP